MPTISVPGLHASPSHFLGNHLQTHAVFWWCGVSIKWIGLKHFDDKRCINQSSYVCQCFELFLFLAGAQSSCFWPEAPLDFLAGTPCCMSKQCMACWHLFPQLCDPEEAKLHFHGREQCWETYHKWKPCGKEDQGKQQDQSRKENLLPLFLCFPLDSFKQFSHLSLKMTHVVHTVTLQRRLCFSIFCWLITVFSPFFSCVRFCALLICVSYVGDNRLWFVPWLHRVPCVWGKKPVVGRSQGDWIHRWMLLHLVNRMRSVDAGIWVASAGGRTIGDFVDIT